MTSPKNDTTQKTDKANAAANTAIDQLRTPLLAALGAGNLAGQAVVDVVGKARERVETRGEAAKKNFDELPGEFENLRGKLDPAELRKAIDEYTEAALKLYNQLAESGEEALSKILEQPQVKKAFEQLEGVAGETRGRVDEVLGKVTKRTRSTGEKTANTVQKVAADAAEKVQEVASGTADAVQDAGDDLAHETRSASRKAANKTAPKTTTTTTRRSTTATGTTAAKKTTGGTAK